jgi:hypothetical protein
MAVNARIALMYNVDTTRLFEFHSIFSGNRFKCP